MNLFLFLLLILAKILQTNIEILKFVIIIKKKSQTLFRFLFLFTFVSEILIKILQTNIKILQDL